MSNRNPLERAKALQAVGRIIETTAQTPLPLLSHQLLRSEILKPYEISWLSDLDLGKIAIAHDLITQSRRDPDLTDFLRNLIPYGINPAEITPYIAIKANDGYLAQRLTGSDIEGAIDSIGPRMAGRAHKCLNLVGFLDKSQTPLSDAIGVAALTGARQFQGINRLIKEKASQATLLSAESSDMAAYNVLLDGLGERSQYARALSHGPEKVRQMYEAGLSAGYANETLRLLATEPERWESSRNAGAGSRGTVRSWGQYGDSASHRL